MNKKIIINSPLNPLGYGVVGKNICELLSLECDLHVFPIGQVQVDISEDLSKAINSFVLEYDKDRTVVKIWHQHDLVNRPSSGKYFGWPIFELDTFTEQEKFNLRVPDELIVCSHWAKKLIEDQTQKICHVVPLGVDQSIFYPKDRIKKDKYKFFTIGKLEYRKGHDFIVKCFNKAFDTKDDVELNMMVHNPFLPRDIVQEWYSNFKNTKLGTKINILKPVDSHKDVADFIRENDCGLFPSRAEGWNLELLESMACGKPVITTYYSAHTEYLTNDNCCKIYTSDNERAYDKMGGRWFRGQGNWAELDYEQEDQMVEHMRYCYGLRHDWNKGGIETAKKYTWANSVKKLLEIL